MNDVIFTESKYCKYTYDCVYNTLTAVGPDLKVTEGNVHTHTHTHTHTHVLRLSGLCLGFPRSPGTRTHLDFTEARDSIKALKAS